METEKLGIKKILPTDYFADDTFNAILDDIDIKVVGISHLTSGAHWTIREPDTDYVRKDVVRWPAMKSHQYAECITAGTTSSADTINNYTTGDIVYDGTVVWRIWSLTEQNDNNGGIIKIWLSGYEYKKGDAVLYGKAIYRCIIDHTASSFSTDASKWQEIYASIRPFTVSVYYKTGDTVLQGNLIYKCLTDHVSTNFNADISNWELVGNLVLLHEWEVNKVYHQDEVVTHNGQIYRALSDHTSTTDLETDASNWELVTASIPLWKSDTYYVENSIVHYGNLLYKCVVDHTSGVNFDITKWHVLHDPNAFIRNWISNTQYYQNQVVRYNGNLYRCNTTNNDASFTIAKWDLLTDSINDWVGSRDYVVGQYVNYNGILYKCITANNDANFTIAKWQKVSGGGLDQWEQNTDYIVGDVVVYANKIYQCTTAHTSGATFNADSDKWNEISACITRIPNWEATKDYVIGDLVSHDAKIFRCTTPHTSGNTWDATEEANWEELSPTINEISNWTVSTDYEVGQLVIHDNKLYRCNTNHTSDSTSFSTDITYWDSIGASGIDAWKTGEAYQQGNMVVYNDKIYICDTSHTSVNPFDQTKWHEVSTADIPLWASNTEYSVGNDVIYNNKLYRCTTAHTSTSAFDITKWEEISPTKLDDWQASTDYSVGDYVVNANKIYKCTTAHTSTSTFDKSKWVEISSYDIELWQPSTDYIVGNLVIQDDKIYRCNTAHTSDTTSFGVDIANWDEIGSSGIDTWEQNKLYSVDNVVIYNNKIYKCDTSHTSSTTFDPTKWTEISSSDIDAWSVSTDYVVGDFVYKDNQLYRCITAHTSDNSDFDTDIANWVLLDTKWKAENWVASKLYTANEVVLYDNRLFKCISTHTSAVDFATDANYWQALSARLEPWKVSTYYTVGDTVINNNKLYKCIVAHTSDSTSILTDISNWEIVGSGGIDTWRANEAYTTSNVVIYNNKIYKCNTAHTSGSTFDPTKWDEISSADIGLWQPSTDYKVGNIVIKDNQIYRCKTLHTSDSSDFYTDISKWDILDTRWLANDWTTNTYYFAGEIVLYDNTIYKCTTSHTSLGTFELDKDDWSILNANTREWVSGVSYKVGDIVIYGDNTYKCSIANNDGSFFSSKWSRIDRCNIEVWKPAPDQNTLALLHFDIPGNLEKNEYETPFSRSKSPLSTTGKFGSSMNLSPNKRGIISSPSYEFTDGTEVYTIEFWFYVGGNSAREGVSIYIGGFGSIYRAVYSANDAYLFYNTSYEFVPTNAPVYNAWNHYAFVISASECNIYINGKFERSLTRLDSNPVSISFGDDNAGFASAKDFRIDELRVSNVARYSQEFTPPTEPFEDPNWYGYKKDDLVVYKDKIYKALEDNNDIEFAPSKWVEVSSANTPLWEASIYYAIGDIVLYDNQTYRCTTAHTSNTFLGDIVKWQPLDTNWLVDDWSANKLYLENQVVSYDDSLWKCLETHESVSDDSPANAKIYEASGNVIEVDDTTTIPYTETIDLGSVKHITDIDFTESTSEMSFTYTIETSIDNITYENWTEDAVNAKYIKLIVDSVNIDVGAVSPNAHLTDFTVYGDSDKWIKISSGGSGDLIYATNSDIDNLFN